MSDMNRLRSEIKYLSVLIQKHKESGGAAPARRRPDASKYTWSINNSVEKRSHGDLTSDCSQILRDSDFVKTGRKRAYHPAHSSQSPVKIVRTAAPPSSATMARKTGISFDPKFKWTKDPSKTLLHNPSTSQNAESRNPPVSNFGPTSSKQAMGFDPALNSQLSCFVTKHSHLNSRYKYHKAASGKVTLFQAKEKMTELPEHCPRKSKPSVEVSRKWYLSRLNLKYRTKNSSRKWVSATTKKNPYKLNRMIKSSQCSLLVSNKPSAHRPARSPRRDLKHKMVDRKRQQTKDTSTHITLSKVALEGLLQRHSLTLKQVLAGRAVAKSHETTRSKRQEKTRQHCLYFGRFGKCMRGDSCKFIHDPSRVAVCTRFLRGTCRNEECLFSHKVVKEKVPLCLFFLRGKCSVPHCPYLHVFLGKDAPVCQQFATAGYCPDADKCLMQHIKCCPEFYENGVCSKSRSCKMPHFRTHRLRAKKGTPKEDQNKNDKPRTSKTQMKLANKAFAPTPSSCPDFLSLNVDFPEPMDKPIKREPSLIKPRIGKLKEKISS